MAQITNPMEGQFNRQETALAQLRNAFETVANVSSI